RTTKSPSQEQSKEMTMNTLLVHHRKWCVVGSPLAVLLLTVTSYAAPMMAPMEHVGPHPRSYSDKKARTVDFRPYAHVLHVAPDAQHRTIAAALAAAGDASATNRYAILVAAATYRESPLRMKPFVDLYGGFGNGDWRTPNVYDNATILDAR